MIEDFLKSRYSNFLDGLDIYENKTSLVLSRIIIKKDVRQEGIGSKIMTDLINYADKNKQVIALTPSNDFGGDKNRLIQFYKKFGFKHNKGQYKNFEFRETMIRYPKIMVENISISLKSNSKNNLNITETSKNNIKKLLREQVELNITNETSNKATYNIIYNTREIGLLGISTPSDMSRTIELSYIQLSPDYKTWAMKIITEIIFSLWETFPDINNIILTPKKESVAFWHKIGANRLNDDYLRITKGH